MEIQATTNPDGASDATVAIMDLAGKSDADMAAAVINETAAGTSHISVSFSGTIDGMGTASDDYAGSTVSGRFYATAGSEVGVIVESDPLAPALGGNGAALVGAFGALPYK